MKTSNITQLALCAFLLGAGTLAANADDAPLGARVSDPHAGDAGLRPAPAAPAATPTTAPATTPTAPASPTPARRLERFIGLSLGAQLTDFSAKHTKSGFLHGPTLQAGGYFSPNKPILKDLLLIADIGIYTGDARTDTLLNTNAPYDGPAMPGWDTTHSILKRKSEQMNIPILLTLAYDFQPCENLSLRIGPTLGVTCVFMDSKFTSRTDIHSNDGTLISSLPDSLNKSGSRAIFTYGVTAGTTWALTPNITADLQYRFSATEKLNLGIDRNYGTTLTHQLNLGVSYRF